MSKTEYQYLTLRSTVEILGIPCDTSKSSANITCPMCAKNKHEQKLNLSFDRYGPDDGAFRCPKCGVQGRPLHLWALFRGLPLDPAVAARDYGQWLKTKGNAIVTRPRVIPVSQEVAIADADCRNKTFQALLDSLNLSEEHKENLLKRGLTPEAIETGGYKTYPAVGTTAIAKHLTDNGYVTEGVPGFYKRESGEWCLLHYSQGFLIPQRDGFGRIQGMQIRLDNPPSGMRYLTISSAGKNCGAKGRAYCHFAPGKDLSNVILTEGPLKADIISSFTSIGTLAVQGVNSTYFLRRALFDMKQKGLKKVMIAFDMDRRTNPLVEEAIEKIKALLSELCLYHTVLTWDEQYKGLDDYLCATKG